MARDSGSSGGLVNGVNANNNTSNNNNNNNNISVSVGGGGGVKVPPPVAPKPTRPSERATVESLLDVLECAVPQPRGTAGLVLNFLSVA